ncbi:uncharacterized protein PRCAT00002426001 [Priceomyces carsonii]|uniref:uncharacterized protein n=1 Tax=Priceomyces carsonii TaxID=28549 RepID=UPI002EDB4373|nr:unnamed protein product [Priceomyces carsonii]
MMEKKYTIEHIGNVSVSLPTIIVDLFAYVENQLCEGTFRINGSVRRVRLYSSELRDYRTWLYESNVHDVCGVIKRLLKSYHGVVCKAAADDILQFYNKYERVSQNGKKTSQDFSETKSSSSFKTALTDIEDESLSEFLLQVAKCLVVDNLSSRNGLFLFLLNKINAILKREKDTKMSSKSLAIIFQPYLIDDLNLINMRIFQDILNLLIINSSLLGSEYERAIENFEDSFISLSDTESLDSLMSVGDSSFDSSLGQIRTSSNTRTNSTPDTATKRISLSGRFTSLLDSYSAPVGKLKRFSFELSKDSLQKSKDPWTSVERLIPEAVPHIQYVEEPGAHREDINSVLSQDSMFLSKDSLPRMNSYQEKLDNTTTRTSFGNFKEAGNSLDSVAIEEKKKKNRKSFMDFFRHSTSSLPNSDNSDNDNKSVEALLVNKRDSLLPKKKKSLLKRNISLKLRKK